MYLTVKPARKWVFAVAPAAPAAPGDSFGGGVPGQPTRQDLRFNPDGTSTTGAESAAPPMVANAIQTFVKNVAELRKQLNPKIQYINKILKYERFLVQVASGSKKLAEPLMNEVSQILTPLNNQISQLLAGEAKDSQQLQKLVTQMLPVFDKAFGASSDKGNSSIKPNITTPGEAGGATTPGAAQRAGNWAGGAATALPRDLMRGTGNFFRGLGQGLRGKKPTANTYSRILTASMGSSRSIFKLG